MSCWSRAGPPGRFWPEPPKGRGRVPDRPVSHAARVAAGVPAGLVALAALVVAVVEVVVLAEVVLARILVTAGEVVAVAVEVRSREVVAVLAGIRSGVVVLVSAGCLEWQPHGYSPRARDPGGRAVCTAYPPLPH